MKTEFDHCLSLTGKAPKAVYYSSVSPSNSITLNVSPSTESISQYSGIITSSTTSTTIYRSNGIITSSSLSHMSTKNIKSSYSSSVSTTSIRFADIYPSQTTFITKVFPEHFHEPKLLFTRFQL